MYLKIMCSNVSVVMMRGLMRGLMGDDELDVYMEKARCNTELYSNLRAPLNNVKPSNFLGVTSPISQPF